MASKRDRINLTVAERNETLMMGERNKDLEPIMAKYGISQAKVYRIITMSERIKRQFETCEEFGRFPKRLRRHTADVDRVVLYWYLRCKERNVQVTPADIQTKALEINKKLNGHSSFTASSSWLKKFKKRYNITLTNIKINVSTADEISFWEVYAACINSMMQRSNCALKNVYNVVYTTMMWKVLPEKTSIFNSEESVESLKMCEDHVTALICANATGCHKLPIVIIGSDPDIYNVYSYTTQHFSTIYKSNTNACMNSTILKQWYDEIFLESIKERQRENNSEEEYFLLLGNGMLDYNVKELNHIDKFVTIKIPPFYASPLRQPMNRGIITCFKRKYRIEFLEAIRPISSEGIAKQNVINLYKDLDMWDCCRIVHDAWLSVDNATLTYAWEELLIPKHIQSMKCTKSFDADIRRAVQLLHKLPGCEECEEKDVINWFRIESKYDTDMKVCDEEVLQKLENHILGQVNRDISGDEVGPSHA